MTRHGQTTCAPRGRFAMAALLGLSAALASAPARADDAAACDAGVAMIAAEADKDHPKAVADALKTALRVAKREKEEQEYGECLDAVEDAEKALKR